MFKDERLRCAPSRYGDIYRRVGVRGGTKPFVSVTFDEPSDVAWDDDAPDKGTAEWHASLWRSSVGRRRWTLSIAIVGRFEDHNDDSDTHTMSDPPSQDRRWDEMKAMAVLQNAVNWGN